MLRKKIVGEMEGHGNLSFENHEFIVNYKIDVDQEFLTSRTFRRFSDFWRLEGPGASVPQKCQAPHNRSFSREIRRIECWPDRA